MLRKIIQQKNKIFKPILNGNILSFKKENVQGMQSFSFLNPFVPKGYPNTVSNEYTKYSIYAFLSTISGTIGSTISTQLLLQSLGISNGIAIASSVALNWVIKDFAGLTGGIFYSAIVSTKFDSEPKRQRFRAKILLNIANIIEVSSIYFPGSFLLIASGSNILKNIGFLAAGGSNASINSSFIKKGMPNNLGDITVKMGAQKTFGSLLGTLGGVGLSLVFGTQPFNLVMTFIPITICNLVTLYISTNSIVSKSFNKERLEILLDNYFKNTKITSPYEIYTKETFILNYKSRFDIRIQESLENININLDNSEIYTYEFFEIINENNVFYIWYFDGISNKDIVKSFYIIYNNYYFNENFNENEFELFYENLSNNSEWQLNNIYITSTKLKVIE